MKKFLAIMVSFALVMFSACGTEAKTIEVKNGFIDISVEEFESNFNAQLSDEYTKAHLKKGLADDEYSYYLCNLGTGIKLSVLATPDETMIYTADLSLDMNKADEGAKNNGYYFAKLIYTVAPDITGDEIINISEEINMSSPFPGETHSTMRNNIIYSQSVDDAGTVLHLSVIAHKQ